jgi:hypothetical protein
LFFFFGLTLFFAGSFRDLVEGGKGVSVDWTDSLMSVLFQLEMRNEKKPFLAGVDDGAILDVECTLTDELMSRVK